MGNYDYTGKQVYMGIDVYKKHMFVFVLVLVLVKDIL